MADDVDLQEYFALRETISSFDQRLLTIKGWGVTLSLAALGFGFQYRSYGMFLVSATSGVAFWALEAVTKRHQMRHYPRIRDIEVARCLRAPEDMRAQSAPRTDWSWTEAGNVLRGKPSRGRDPVAVGFTSAYRWTWLLPHVALPHGITVLVGAVLFSLGRLGYLENFALGAPGK